MFPTWHVVITNAWLGGTSFLGALEGSICLRSPLHTRITHWCSCPLLGWRTWGWCPLSLLPGTEVQYGVINLEKITDAVLMSSTIYERKDYRKTMHRPHHYHHAAVARFFSMFSDYNTSKKRSQFTNQCCFTHSLFPHSGGTNAAHGEWKNLFLLPFSLFQKPLSPPQGVCEGGAGGKERRMYKILIPLENVACPLHLTLRTPSAQYVVIPNTTTLASHQALHTPKHYHTAISSHMFMSFEFVRWNPNNPEGEKKHLQYLLWLLAIYLSAVVLWDWNIRRCRCYHTY